VSRKEISAWIDNATGKGESSKQKAAGKGARAGAKTSTSASVDVGKGSGASVRKGRAKATSGGAGDGVIGACPCCGKTVREIEKGCTCSARCGFVLWKDKLSKWGKTISPALAAKLIKGKPVPLRSLVSAKEGKAKFDAKAQLHQAPQYGWSVRLIFVEK